MNKKILLTGIILGFLAIILGAFGAHLLKKSLSIDQLDSYETAVKYQMYHALFLILLSFIPKLNKKIKKNIYFLVVIGIILFSGSIYLLATNGLFIAFNFKTIGFITPIGGLLLLSAWFILFLKVLKMNSNKLL